MAWASNMMTGRVTGYDTQTAFSSRPPHGRHHLEWGHGLFCLGVEETDVLIADGSVPHGNWFTGDEDVYTIFITMHPSNDDAFALGFENKTYTQCYMIFEELGAGSQSWSPTGIQQFLDNPTLLSQVKHLKSRAPKLTHVQPHSTWEMLRIGRYAHNKTRPHRLFVDRKR